LFEYSLIPTSEPFDIAHADSEIRPTATRSLAHFICVICDIRGSFFLELASCAFGTPFGEQTVLPKLISFAPPRHCVSLFQLL